MKLYIETKNNQAKNHPAFEENLIAAFGVVPETWEAFTATEQPTPTVYQVLDSDIPTYAKVNGIWTHVWALRDMTAEEKTAKQQAVIAAFNNREYASNWAAWTFDEATCRMQPPIPRPEPVDGLDIRWCGADNNWKEVPDYPVDDNQYKFDFLAWQWVQDVN